MIWSAGVCSRYVAWKLACAPNPGRAENARAGGCRPAYQGAAAIAAQQSAGKPPHSKGGETTTTLDFSPRRDASWGLPEGRGFSPAEIAAPALCSSRAPRSLRLQAARGARHGNNQEGLVTAGLKPRPSHSLVRNPDYSNSSKLAVEWSCGLPSGFRVNALCWIGWPQPGLAHRPHRRRMLPSPSSTAGIFRRRAKRSAHRRESRGKGSSPQTPPAH